MVAAKTEYDADTDDEAVLPAANKNSSASHEASMVAVKKEYNADTDSDEEQQQQKQPTKKAKPYRDEHKKLIAEIRKSTGRLLSLGRRDGDKLKQVNRIAHDLKSLSSELKKSAKDVALDHFERNNILKVRVRDSDNPNAQKHLAYLCSCNGPLNSVWIRRDSHIYERVRVEKSRVENLEGASCADMLKALKNGEGAKKEYDVDTDSDEQKQQPVTKEKRDDNEHEKYLAKIREISDQLLTSSKQITIRHSTYAGSKWLAHCRVANDLEWFSNDLMGYVKDVERKIEVEEQKLREQRVRKESWEQFQCKNGLMVWARDSDNPHAQQHLAYLCSCYGGPDDRDYVWIIWDSFIGKRVRVPKSRIEDLEGAYSKMYAWCAGSKLYMLPYNRIIFWRKLLKCKTWGDMKAISNDEDIEMLKDRYKRRWDDWGELEEDHEKHINNLKDDTVIDLGICGDFDLQENGDYGDDTACGWFPPLVELLMYDEFYEKEDWVRFNYYGKVIGGWNSWFFEIDKEDREEIFNDMEKRELVAIYCPQMRDIFQSYHGFS